MASGKGTSDEEVTLALQRGYNDNDEDCNKAQKSLDTEQHETEPPALPVDDLSLLISSSSLSHQNALRRCIEDANLWVSKSEHQIVPNSDINYADLGEKLTKIMGLEYSINPPADDVVVEEARKSSWVQGSVTQCEQKGTTHHYESCTGTDEDESPVCEGKTHHESSTETDEDQSPVLTHEEYYMAPKKPGTTVTYYSEPDIETDEDKPRLLKERYKPEDWLDSDYDEEKEREPWQPHQDWPPKVGRVICGISRDTYYDSDNAYDSDCY